MADIIVVRAVNGAEKSKPFRMYRTSEAQLPKQFVLRLDAGTDRLGKDIIKVGNSNIGLIASHDPDWISETLTGYRRKQDDATFVIAEVMVDNIPAIGKLAKVEAF